jgi:hypothetical protein
MKTITAILAGPNSRGFAVSGRALQDVAASLVRVRREPFDLATNDVVNQTLRAQHILFTTPDDVDGHPVLGRPLKPSILCSKSAPGLSSDENLGAVLSSSQRIQPRC